MDSTIFGYFSSQEQAQTAANTIRERFPDRNLAITVRQQNTADKSTEGMSGYTGTAEITKQAMNLGSTMGSVAGQMMGLAVGSMMNAPLMMMNMVMTPMNTTASNMSNGNKATQSSAQSDCKDYTVSFQGNGSVEEITNVLKEQGAAEIKIYRQNT